MVRGPDHHDGAAVVVVRPPIRKATKRQHNYCRLAHLYVMEEKPCATQTCALGEESPIAITPAAPYYAVIFTSLRTEGENGYEAMTELMCELARQQPGYLGMESARGDGGKGLGITVSYWQSMEDIRSWKMNLDHRVAQKRGKDLWYSNYKVRISKVERDYSFEA